MKKKKELLLLGLFHQSTHKMFILSILAAGYVIGVVQSTPTSTYQRRDLQLADHPELILFNQIHGIEDEDMLEASPGRDAGGSRIKRLGSLSIVNPLDVLRERVLLELARRKMRQNQRQVDANRRLLQSIGKRAIPNTVQLVMDSSEDPDPTDFASSKPNDYLYAYRIPENDIENVSQHHPGQHHQLNTDKVTDRQQRWQNHGDDPVVREAENEQTRRMANEYNLL